MTSQIRRYQTFVAIWGNPDGKVTVVYIVLSFHEQQKYPNISLHENSFEFVFQIDWIYYVDLRQSNLVVELKLVKWCGHDTCTVKEAKKEHTAKELITADAYEETADNENTE